MIKNKKKGFKKRLLEDVKSPLKKRKTKSQNMVRNDIKIFLKMKGKGSSSIEKLLQNEEKHNDFTNKD